jgi:hypothetical protein
MGVAGYNNRILGLPLRITAVAAGILMVVPMVAPSVVGMVIFAGIYMHTRKKVDTLPLEAA